MNGSPSAIAVLGLGLIGGSATKALAAVGHRVLGYDADPTTRATARTAAARAAPGKRWQVAGSIADAVTGADIVIVAVPLPAVETVFTAVAATGYSGIVTDVTSVKDAVRDLAAKVLHKGGQQLSGFVGGHPMAGRESSGFAASDVNLFDGCPWVLCLDDDTALDDWLALAALLTAGLKVRVVPTTAVDHDRAVAAVSHVPHLLASALAAHAGSDPLALTLAAGSFRDGSRVAATRSALVAAMCGGNALAVRNALDAVLHDLQGARAALEGPEPIPAIGTWLTPGNAARSGWPPPAGPTVVVSADVDALRQLGRNGGWITAVAKDRRSLTAVYPA